MFWRVVATIGAITFVVGGIDVLSEDCPAIDFGGTRRSLTYECVPSGTNGAMSPAAAGGLMLLGGTALLTFAWGPAVYRLAGRPGRRPTSTSVVRLQGGSTAPFPASSAQPSGVSPERSDTKDRASLSPRSFPALMVEDGEDLQVVVVYDPATQAVTIASAVAPEITRYRASVASTPVYLDWRTRLVVGDVVLRLPEAASYEQARHLVREADRVKSLGASELGERVSTNGTAGRGDISPPVAVPPPPPSRIDDDELLAPAISQEEVGDWPEITAPVQEAGSLREAVRALDTLLAAGVLTEEEYEAKLRLLVGDS